MNLNLTLLITVTILIATSPCSAMETNTIIKPRCIAFIDDTTLVVGGKNGCGIFDTKSQTLIKKLTNNPMYHVAANNNVIAFIDDSKIKCFNAKTGIETWKADHPTYDDILTKTEAEKEKKGFLWIDDPITLSTAGNMLFAFTNYGSNVTAQGSEIATYNHENKTSRGKRIITATTTTNFPIISCHPITNHLLIPVNKNTLALVQPDRKAFIEILHMNIDTQYHGGQYSPDGTMIAISDSAGRSFICNLEENYSPAYQLGKDDNEYITAVFHPHTFLLALLSNTRNTAQYTVQYWDYKSRVLIAETNPLAINRNKIVYYFRHNRLAFSPNGKQLAVALKDRWLILPVPYHNYALITFALRNNGMLKELIDIIMQNIAHNTDNHYRFSFLDLIALAHVAPLSIPHQKYDQDNVNMSVEKPTTHRNIKIIYHTQNS